MTTKQISTLLGSSYVRKINGQFKYWRSYYYHNGLTPGQLVDQVKAKIPNAVITGSGDHMHSFVGGASSGSAKDSYVWVTFTVPETPVAGQPALINIASKKWWSKPVTAGDLMKL